MKKFLIGIAVFSFLFQCSLALAHTPYFGQIQVLSGTPTTIPEAASLTKTTKQYKTMFTLEGNSIRIRYDYGTSTISATSGHKMIDGDVFFLDNLEDIKSFRCIQTTTGTSILSYSISEED